MKKLGKPIMVGLNLEILDMVTKDKWEVTHMMCLIPEEPRIEVSYPGEKDVLDFNSICENDIKSLAVAIENNNSVKVSINLELITVSFLFFFISFVFH